MNNIDENFDELKPLFLWAGFIATLEIYKKEKRGKKEVEYMVDYFFKEFDKCKKPANLIN